MVNHLEN